MKHLRAPLFLLALAALTSGCFRRAYGVGYYVAPRPVYVQPRPVYVQPRPVVVQGGVYAAPPPVVQGSVVVQ